MESRAQGVKMSREAYGSVEEVMAEFLDDSGLEGLPMYGDPICGMDIETFGCIPSKCLRVPGHAGECSVLPERECQVVDDEARKMLKRLFPQGLL